MKNKPFFSAMLVSLLAFGLTLSSCAPSATKQAIMSAPSVDAVTGLNDKLIWLQNNAQSGGNYTIELNADEKVNDPSPFSGCGFSGCGSLSYKDKKNITITLKGVGTSRTIFRSYPGTIFWVSDGVTLILDNITLKGKPTSGLDHGNSVVVVHSGGTLVMNDGSTITGGFNNASHRGGGVVVSDGGTFIMKGGTISGNTCFPIPNPGVIAASKGKANSTVFDDPKFSKGGGVYVSGGGKALFSSKEEPSGTFIKTGGTITGYASDPQNGNVIRGFAGNDVIHGNGHAIYFAAPEGKEGKSIDITVGPEISFNFSNGKFSEIQKEESKREEITAEPEDNISSEGAEILEEQLAPPDVPTVIQTQDAAQKYQEAILKAQQEMQEMTQKALQEAMQKMPASQREEIQKMQEVIQKQYVTAQQQAIQKIPVAQREATQKAYEFAAQQAAIQVAIQKMSVEQREDVQKVQLAATQKYQEAILKAQQEMQGTQGTMQRTTGRQTCQTETNKARQIFDKCKRIGNGKSGYGKCTEEYKNQKAKAEQLCRSY